MEWIIPIAYVTIAVLIIAIGARTLKEDEESDL